MREASEWLARLNADDVTSEDRARFEAWRSVHPLHARAYDDLTTSWARFTAAAPFVRAVSFAQSMNETASLVGEARGEADGVRRSRQRGVVWAAAATLLATAVGLCWLYVGRGLPADTFVTAIGEHSTLSLPDGSTLELNSDSRARIEYSQSRRVIHLDRGEAYFKVAHDAQRPFWVVGGRSWVRAVGTAFNVDVRSSGVRVTVSEGIVKVGTVDPLLEHISLDDSVLAAPNVSVVTAGQEADVHGTATQTRELSAVQLARSVGWRGGVLYFENQPLSDVIEELKRYTSLELIVSDDELRELPVGGTFQASPQGAEALLTMLEQGFGLMVHREPGRVVIERKPN